MIFICVKWTVKPEHAEVWPELTRAFTEATRAEPGNIFFEWSRSLEEEHTYVLVEGFEDDAAEAHVSSDHFAAGLEAMRPLLVSTPQIISHQVPVDGWGPMGELQID
mgnify:CR=1 FL=1